MKTILDSAAARACALGSPLAKVATKPLAWVFALAACTLLTGCFGFLKPAASTARHFVLTPVTATERGKGTSGSLGVGVGQVKLPPYLFDTSFAVRKHTNEITYLPGVLWAERLDSGFQRVLAANLSILVPSEKIQLSRWSSEDVSAGVHVAVERFDVDADGNAVLVAWWRILSPAGDKTLKAGEARLQNHGPAPDADPAGAVATLSKLLADLSRQIAQALKETTLARQAAVDPKHFR